MIPFNLMMVLMFFNMSVACHSMGVPWAMVIKPLNNTEKQPKLKYLRPEDNRPHWSADGETGMQRILNEDGSDVHRDPAKVPSKEIVVQTIGLLRKQNKTFTWPFPNNRLTTKAPNTPTPRDVDVWEFSQNKPYTTPPTPNTRDSTTVPSYLQPPTIGPQDSIMLYKMIGANSPASLRFRDPIEAALEEIEIDRKNVPKYISVGAYSEQVIEKEQISAQTYWWDYVNFHNNTQLRDKRSLVSVGGAAITVGKAIAKGAIKEFVFKLSEPILKSMISSKEDDVMESWTNTMLSNTMIASSPTQMNIRYHLKNNDGQSVLTTLQNNKVKYNPESIINSIKPGSDTGSRLEFACRKNIPYVDDLLKERVGSSAMVTNTLVNAFFEDMKKTIKAEFVEAGIKFEDMKKTIKAEFVEAGIKFDKSYTKSSDIQTISTNILKTVTDILASMDTYEKIAIFCFLASVLIVNFIVLYSIWRNQRAIVALFDLQANRINEIQMQNESRAPNPSSIYRTPMYPTSQP